MKICGFRRRLAVCGGSLLALLAGLATAGVSAAAEITAAATSADGAPIGDQEVSEVLVTAVRGPNGGLELAREPGRITPLDGVEALEGRISAVDCTLDPDQCDRAGDCVTRDVWAEMAAAMETSLRRHTLADLAEPLEAFFNAVMVKCEDPALRAARLTLLHRLRRAFLRVADFSLWQ